MTENAVERQIVQYMQSLGWRAHRNHVGVFQAAGGQRVTVGTPGWPDWDFLRKPRDSAHGRIDLIHVEIKAPGKKPSKHQFEVLASLNHLGELAVWADSLKSFQRVYTQYFPAQ